MIKLTSHGGGEFYFNPERINVIAPYEAGEKNLAYIEYDQDRYVVIASPEEVVRKIMEYKLAMQQQKVAYELALIDSPEDKLQIKDMLDTHLKELAGLEAGEDD